MIRIFTILALAGISLLSVAQSSDNKLYNPEADAFQQVEEALGMAKQENKHVLIQVGGNWCPWCIRLHDFIESTPQLDSLVQADYVLITINYSRENMNPEMMESLEFPQRFGFPVLVILNQDGHRIHTQNTGILEKGDFYSEEKVADVLKHWNRSSIDPKTYQIND
ncbi:MAG: thioredoxin family protein [Bacteroidales bacterium]|nr:thioredoxin family protein [Bacteroidales bacterium]